MPSRFVVQSGFEIKSMTFLSLSSESKEGIIEASQKRTRVPMSKISSSEDNSKKRVRKSKVNIH